MDGRPLTPEKMLSAVRVLKVSGCRRLTDEMVHDVATRCTFLEVRRSGALRGVWEGLCVTGLLLACVPCSA
jgi:hypothetical protein